MFVLCDNCHNHYDDENQSAECAGIGVTVSHPTAAGSAHAVIHPMTAGDAHVAYTRGARMDRARKAAQRPVVVPSASADPSDG